MRHFSLILLILFITFTPRQNDAYPWDIPEGNLFKGWAILRPEDVKHMDSLIFHYPRYEQYELPTSTPETFEEFIYDLDSHTYFGQIRTAVYLQLHMWAVTRRKNTPVSPSNLMNSFPLALMPSQNTGDQADQQMRAFHAFRLGSLLAERAGIRVTAFAAERTEYSFESMDFEPQNALRAMPTSMYIACFQDNTQSPGRRIASDSASSSTHDLRTSPRSAAITVDYQRTAQKMLSVKTILQPTESFAKILVPDLGNQPQKVTVTVRIDKPKQDRVVGVLAINYNNISLVAQQLWLDGNYARHGELELGATDHTQWKESWQRARQALESYEGMQLVKLPQQAYDIPDPSSQSISEHTRQGLAGWGWRSHVEQNAERRAWYKKKPFRKSSQQKTRSPWSNQQTSIDVGNVYRVPPYSTPMYTWSFSSFKKINEYEYVSNLFRLLIPNIRFDLRVVYKCENIPNRENPNHPWLVKWLLHSERVVETQGAPNGLIQHVDTFVDPRHDFLECTDQTRTTIFTDIGTSFLLPQLDLPNNFALQAVLSTEEALYSEGSRISDHTLSPESNSNIKAVVQLRLHSRSDMSIGTGWSRDQWENEGFDLTGATAPTAPTSGAAR